MGFAIALSSRRLPEKTPPVLEIAVPETRVRGGFDAMRGKRGVVGATR